MQQNLKRYIAVWTILLALFSCGNESAFPPPDPDLKPIVKSFKEKKGEQRYEEFVAIIKTAFNPPSSIVGHVIDFYTPKKETPLNHFIEWCGQPNARMIFSEKDTVFYEIGNFKGRIYYGILIIENEIIKEVSIIPQKDKIEVTKRKIDDHQEWIRNNPKYKEIDFSQKVLKTFGLELGADVTQFITIAENNNIKIFRSMNSLNKRVGSVEFTKPLDGCTDALSLKADILDNIIYRIKITTRTDNYYKYLKQELTLLTTPTNAPKEKGFDDYILVFGSTPIRISIYKGRSANSHIYFCIDKQAEIARDIYDTAYSEYLEKERKKTSDKQIQRTQKTGR